MHKAHTHLDNVTNNIIFRESIGFGEIKSLIRLLSKILSHTLRFSTPLSLCVCVRARAARVCVRGRTSQVWTEIREKLSKAINLTNSDGSVTRLFWYFVNVCLTG